VTVSALLLLLLLLHLQMTRPLNGLRPPQGVSARSAIPAASLTVFALLLLPLLLPPADDVTIEATSQGISKVYYTRGKCDAGQQVRRLAAALCVGPTGCQSTAGHDGIFAGLMSAAVCCVTVWLISADPVMTGCHRGCQRAPA
jgi:hypothetical protein